MNKSRTDSIKDSSDTDLKEIRERAEIALENTSTLKKSITTDTLSFDLQDQQTSENHIEYIIHELQVHQIELELQNEELQQAQAELQRIQAQYFDLYEHAPVGYITLDLKGIIIESNATAGKLLGLTKETLINKPLNQYIIPDDQDIFYLYRQRLLNGKTNNRCELHLLTPNNHFDIFYLQSSIVNDIEGKPYQLRTIISNIREQKRIENELLKSQSRLQTIVDTAINGIVTIDSQGTILMFNKAAETMFGYSAQEIVGHNVKQIMPSPYRENHDDYIKNYLHSGQAKIIGLHRDVHGQRKNGTIFPLTLSIGEFYEGKQIFFTGILQDISERIQAENCIKESEERLSLAMEAMEAGYWDWDLINNQIIHNAKWYEILGFNEKMQQRPAESFIPLLHDDDRQAVLEKINQCLSGSGRFKSEHRLRHSQGHYDVSTLFRTQVYTAFC